MTPEEIRKELLRVLKDSQARNEEPMPDLGGDACPLLELPGFDSLIAEEVTIDLCEGLGCEISDKIRLFGTKQDPRTLSEIVDQLRACVNGGSK